MENSGRRKKCDQPVMSKEKSQRDGGEGVNVAIFTNIIQNYEKNILRWNHSI